MAKKLKRKITKIFRWNGGLTLHSNVNVRIRSLSPLDQFASFDLNALFYLFQLV